jgi:colanic acid/amylovoran biosynthesis glycosyltransferase
MRLIYVTSRLPYGPGEAFLIPEINHLIRQGHPVRIVPVRPGGTIVNEDAGTFAEEAAATPMLSAGILTAAAREMACSPRESLATLRLLARSRSRSVLRDNLAVYPRGLWLGRLACDWHADHIHACWATTSATVALTASRLTGIPWSFTAHRYDIVKNNLLAPKLQSASFARFISRSGRGMAQEICGSELAGKAFCLHLGVELPAVPSAERARPGGATRGTSGRSAPASSRPPVILCPAQLKPVKGHAYLIEAAALLQARGRGVSLWLAGEGELESTLRGQVEQSGLGHAVRFLGNVPHLDLLEIYRRGEVDVVVLPSVDLGSGVHEGIPVSLMEAMSFGIPVVSTTTGGIPELLEGGAGLLVPPCHPVALADAIAALADDPVRARETGRRGRERVEQEFSAERIASQLIARFATGGLVAGRSRLPVRAGIDRTSARSRV